MLDLFPGEQRRVGARGRRRGLECCGLERSPPTATRSTASSFDGRVVTWTGDDLVDAGIRLELELPAVDDPKWLVPGVFYGENRPAACTRHLPALTRRSHVDVERMESDAWSFRADRCATPAVLTDGAGLATSETQPARAERRRLCAARRRPPHLARLPVPRGAAALRRLRDAGAARRAHVPVAAGRARRARVRRARARRPPSSRACAAAAPFADPAWVSVEDAAAARRVGSLPLALQADSAAPDRDRGVRPRRVRRSRRPRPHARLVGQRRAVRLRAPAARSPRRQRRLRRRRRVGARPHRGQPHARRDVLGAVDGRRRLDDRLASRPHAPARAHARRRGALHASRRRPLGATRRARTSPSRCAAQRDDGALPAAHHVADRRSGVMGGHGRHGVDPGARRGGRARRSAPRRRVLRTVRALVRRAGGRRSRADLRGRVRRADGVRRARGLGDRGARRRLAAHLPLQPTTSRSASARCSAGTGSARAAPTRRRRRTSTCTRSG